jgi:SAM-dependent MidA family methyltransferase
MTEKERIGPEGDYYTSPHLHPLFGYTIGVQIEEMWQMLERPEGFCVVEVGAGRGYLAEGILQYLEQRGLSDRIGYVVVERNPHQRKKQGELLRGYDLRWVEGLEEIEGLNGVVLSNELLDAYPVHLVQFRDGEFCEVYVAHDEGFKEVLRPVDERLREYLSHYRVPEIEGYRTEVNLRIGDFLSDVRKSLGEGFVVTIDYGYPYWEYYAEERLKGTLLCYRRHHIVEDPYLEPGTQDITAHVNFTYLHEEGLRQGFQSVGYTAQGTFLVCLGIDRLLADRLEQEPSFIHEIPKIKGLLWGMGESHKVMIQYKGRRTSIPSLRGFQLRNRLSRLTEGL